MKKVLTLTVVAAMLLFVACEKEGKNAEVCDPTPDRVLIIPSDGKTASVTMLVSRIGHEASTCNGCVYSGGKMVHENCMGNGHYCAFAAAVQLQQVGTAVTATTTDTFGLTSLDFFLIPDRSLEYMDDKGNPIYLNIPKQMVFRDTTTLQFTFTGLSFSERPMYSNN